MYCKYCGKLIDDDSMFCKHCGKKQSESKFLSESENEVISEEINRQLISESAMENNEIWFAEGMSTNWFDYTRILISNGKRNAELRLGCAMCGYKNNSSYPCVVSIGTKEHVFDKSFYKEKVKPRASNIIKEFFSTHNIDKLIDDCEKTVDNEISLNWVFDDDY